MVAQQVVIFKDPSLHYLAVILVVTTCALPFSHTLLFFLYNFNLERDPDGRGEEGGKKGKQTSLNTTRLSPEVIAHPISAAGP